MADLEIWGIAKRLIEEHGELALGYAAEGAVQCHQADDTAGEAIWCRAIDLISELTRKKLGEQH
jgi:hypothetical protein